MKTPWFKPWGCWYRPIHPVGWLILVLSLLFCLQTFRAIDRRSHSATDTLYNVFPFVASTVLLFEMVARKTAR
ncbi:MAG TPA: hypothetical protein VMF06_23280 [Candidatus Limnocylindria bacterium]|jgi:hypothetical protein|nr:hypothetical protein [Candidatus Limnocylindria bacterium]